jgi:hypothetical protein
MQLEKLKKMQKLNQTEMNFIYGSTALTNSTSGDVDSKDVDAWRSGRPGDSKNNDKPKLS